MHAQFSVKLKKSFYTRSALVIAPKLLGKILVRNSGETVYAGIITETEAYLGENDDASHSRNGKTKRNQTMFEEGGRLYVYFTYGSHYCCNVVTGKTNSGEAVLIRSIEPVAGIETMAFNRFGKKAVTTAESVSLTNGPGKLCKAFGIDTSLNNESLLGNSIYITEDIRVKPANIVQSTRIGISRAAELMYRFYISGNKFVSRG